MLRTAVIDNDTLVNLTKLKQHDIFNAIRFLFSQIHIPQEVRKEYEVQEAKEPDRVWVLERLRPNEGFYSFCTRYDSATFTLLRGVKDIHKGEAEAVAQKRSVDAHYILSDDIKFQIAIKKVDSTIKVFTTLHIIAMLDIRKFVANPESIVKSLHSVHPFKSSHLRTAYIESAKELGITLSKKVLNNKCSLTKLGLN
jgi:predicted nucleic acid-binding protein